MRLDKWLWCARFFKTRAMAAEAIKTGKVKVAGERIKSAKTVIEGDRISIRRGPYSYSFTVLSLTKSRKSAKDAALLYQEDEESIAARELTAAQLKMENAMYSRSKGRPTKRERREFIKFTKGKS